MNVSRTSIYDIVSSLWWHKESNWKRITCNTKDEIDTEIVTLLDANAAAGAGMVWSKTLPVGVSKAEHYKLFVA